MPAGQFARDVRVDGHAVVIAYHAASGQGEAAAITPWDAASLARVLLAKALEAGEWAPCKLCHAPMLWAVTESGAGIPLDIGDDPAGNLAARQENGKVRVRSRTGTGVLGTNERPVMSHFTTCPKADEARRPRGVRPGGKRVTLSGQDRIRREARGRS
jgi:hypothetical protein